MIGSYPARTPAADHDAWLGYLAAPDVARGHAHRHRGRLPARPRRRPGPRPRRRARRRRGAARGPRRRCRPHRPGWSRASPPAAPRTPDRSPSSPATTCPATAPSARRRRATSPRLVDPGLADWIDGTVSFVTTMVDRITPRTTDGRPARRRGATGVGRPRPVVTEPFTEWVLSGDFPAGRPALGEGRRHLRRRHRPLRGPQALAAQRRALAAGLRRRGAGHQTIAEAVADDDCREWMQQWWAEAARHIDAARPTCSRLPCGPGRPVRQPADPAQARPDRRRRSQKLPIRILPVVRGERAAGRMPRGRSGFSPPGSTTCAGSARPSRTPGLPRTSERAGSVREVVACSRPTWPTTASSSRP